MNDESAKPNAADPIAEWRSLFALPKRSFLRRVATRIALLFSPTLARQRDFNVAVLDLLSDLRGDLAAIQRDSRQQTEDILRDLKQVAEDLRSDIQGAEAGLARELVRIEEKIPAAVRRNDALVAAIDRKIEALDARVRDIVNPVIAPDAPEAASYRTDFVYRRVEDALRGSEGEIREVLGRYVRLARDVQPLVDAGCGRGELLDRCRAEGVAAFGFDTNERSVADLVARGIDARLGAVPQCLAELEAGSAGSIAAIHVVEHLPFDAFLGLFTESARVLRPGGLLMIETPNADSMRMSASEFWKDPTHVGLRHSAAMVTLGRELAFDVVELSTSAPYPEGAKLPVPREASEEVRALALRLNDLLFGDQNLVLVLRKAKV